MAKGIQEGNGGTQLMSYHPTGEISSHYWFTMSLGYHSIFSKADITAGWIRYIVFRVCMLN